MASLRIGIMGAGAIGCYVGGRLAAAGADVVFVGRERLRQVLTASGLSVSGLNGVNPQAAPKVVYETETTALADRDVVLCCVKSAHTEATARALAAVLRPDAVVVSLQNGVRNADTLRAHLPNVLGGIVSFNVVEKEGGHFRQATSGPLVVENGRPDVSALLARTGELKATADIRPLQWSKLVMNLNNAVSALTDQPTVQLIFGPGFRQSLAAIIEEAVAVLKQSGTRTARLGPLPIGAFPFVLRLPAPLLKIVAGAQLKVDPEARSSMWEDLARGRKTEVDYLNGEIVRLAQSRGVPAPLNTRVVQLIHEVEAKGAGSPKLSADALWAALHARL